MMRPMSFVKPTLAALVVFGCLVATARAAADPNGTWTWKFTTQGGQDIEFSLALKAEGDKLTGQLSLPMGDKIDIKDGTFKNDEASFTTEVERTGNTFQAN